MVWWVHETFRGVLDISMHGWESRSDRTKQTKPHRPYAPIRPNRVGTFKSGHATITFIKKFKIYPSTVVRLNPGYKEPLAPTVLPYISGSLYSRFTSTRH